VKIASYLMNLKKKKDYNFPFSKCSYIVSLKFILQKFSTNAPCLKPEQTPNANGATSENNCENATKKF